MFGVFIRRYVLVRLERRELVFFFKRGWLGESLLVNVCFVFLIACFNGYSCFVGEVSFGIWGV